jgi:CRP-like cAMP-binding protein
MANENNIAITERVLFLRTIPMLRELPAGELASIARSLRAHSFAKGDVVVREDEPASAVHMITSGAFEMSRKGHSYGVIHAPNAIGFLPLMARMADGFKVVAHGPTRTLEADADAVYELLEEQFDLLIHVMRDTAHMLLLELQRTPHILFQHMQQAAASIAIPSRPLDVVERIFLLRRMTPFRATSIDALALLSRSFVEQRFAAGETLWRAGDPSGAVVVLVAGKLEALVRKGDEVTRFDPGATVGGIESMAGEPRWFDLVTKTPAVILRGRSSGLIEVFEDNHDMARDFLAMSANALVAIWDARTLSGDPPTGALEQLRFLQVQPPAA